MPWITPSILEDALGELATEAASRYLVEHLPGRYAFREQFSRSAISQHLFHSLPDSPPVIGQQVLQHNITHVLYAAMSGRQAQQVDPILA